MRLCLLLLAIFFCKITYAGDNNNFYEQRHNFLKNYIEQLKTLQKKEPLDNRPTNSHADDFI